MFKPSLSSLDASFTSTPDQVVPFSSKPSRGVCSLRGSYWLDDIMALHDAARTTLPDGLGQNLVARDTSYFLDALNEKNGHVLAVIDNDRAVCCVVLRLADSVASARRGQALTYPDEMGSLDSTFDCGSVAVVQSLCIAPTFQGQGYAGKLIRAALAKAQRHSVRTVFAQVASANTIGQHCFARQGFIPVMRWSAGHERILLVTSLPSIS